MFHGKPDGETTHVLFHGKLDGETRALLRSIAMGDPLLDEFSLGFLTGLLIGEGHFGGDGRQPQITLRMHVRHERLFRWLERALPAGKLYGPYRHGGREYYQWMVRGSYLKETLAPLLASRLDSLDTYAATRFRAMCARYRIAVPAAE